VRDGTFREDLLFRLNVIPLDLPPLRQRPDDIPLLVRHFGALHRARTGHKPPPWGDDAIALLARHRWPGNVRELANIVERLIILHTGRPGDQPVGAAEVRQVLAVDDAPDKPPAERLLPDAAGLEAPLSEQLDEYERELIARALAVSGGNVAETARRLQTDRPNLYRRMKRLGITTDGATPPNGASTV
jgi:two-component system nitrogen regulation response regulator NtrX